MLQAVIFDFYGVIKPDSPAWLRAGMADELGRDRALLEFIKQLRGRYKTALFSNAGSGLLARYFPEGAAVYFDATLLSGETGYGKPSDEAFAAVTERLGLPPADCLLVDDSPEICAAARAFGLQAHQFRSLHQFHQLFDHELRMKGEHHEG